MPAFNKFEAFVQGLARKEYNLHTDALKILLTNVAPDAAADAVKADLTEIAAGHGYVAGGAAITGQDASQTGGVLSLVGDDVQFEASGGAIATFRYAVLYDDTHATDGLIGWWDYGAAVTLGDGEIFIVDFGASILELQ